MEARTITLDDGANAVVATPPGARRGAVVLHEIYGPQPEIDRVVERFARAGYAAIAPDLYHGAAFPICIRRAMRAMRGEGPTIDRIHAARGWLVREAAVAEPQVGLIGFCLGGGFALAAGRGWGAVSTNYGELPTDEVMRGLGPTIGCYGSRDRVFGKKGAQLERRLGSLGVEVETHTFPTVGHSFLTDGRHPIAKVVMRPLFELRYDSEVAEVAWAKIFDFFARHL